MLDPNHTSPLYPEERVIPYQSHRALLKIEALCRLHDTIVGPIPKGSALDILLTEVSVQVAVMLPFELEGM